MTTTDWIIDIALILIVVRQIRAEHLTARFVLLPAAIIGYTAHAYLHAIPTDGNNVAVVAVAVALGTVLGLVGGLLTRVWRGNDGSRMFVQAGPAAAGLWIASMTARLGFIIWITHSAGAAQLATFSRAHDITSATVWSTALILLALSEVIVRVLTILVRARRVGRTVPVATAVEQPAHA